MDKLYNRFISKIEKRHLTDCWEWTAGKHKAGYGKFNIKDKCLLAHRVSYMIHNDRFDLIIIFPSNIFWIVFCNFCSKDELGIPRFNPTPFFSHSLAVWS